MKELTDDGKESTELHFRLTDAALPTLPKSALAWGKTFKTPLWVIKITGLQIFLSKKTVEPKHIRQIKEEMLRLK